MNDLIKVNYDNDRPTVLARELHEFLEVKTAYKDWFPRMREYGFLEGTDFCSFLSESTGGRPAQDAQLTIEMAKEICMLQRNEKGKQARQYFIQLEKDWNSPEKVMARALKIADKKIMLLQDENAQQKQIIAELNPKASYYDVVLQTKDAISTSQIAKDYGKSAMWLNDLLHTLSVQFKQGGVWLLYDKYADKGYTRSKTHTYSGDDGMQHSKLHTYWTQKGRLFIYELLKSHGILPLVEQKN
ncbi:phage antirepressor KilAC domain-containing protein [Fumia xinanensis]|uniref:Phage antirepressor KilAC domain-containing protein n=1 Tax=Fumia xinanensis TaxID=2763659 RepID=A0A926E3J1_9FIRM|nr:phage antirepressor KilAC domain-containing protein [Fumia xinanensis]MBC8558860.1 phage antirepressor KilAC domain-containing protein [Fumia xinanensis]